MNSLVVIGALVSSFVWAEGSSMPTRFNTQHSGDVGITLRSVLGELPEVKEEEFFGWSKSSRVSAQSRYTRMGRPEAYYNTRKSDRCVFPLDILILQDLTDSFNDNIAEMKNVQLKQMVTSLSASHPGSRFSVVGFQDKPIFPLGNRDDACWIFNSDFSSNFEGVYDAYAKFSSYGGADAPENQFGALMAAMGSNKIQWSPMSSEYARLIVVVTDAGPHHADDGSKPADTSKVLAPWQTDYTDATASDLCLNHHYPSAQMVYNKLISEEVYVAALVFDGDWSNGWAANEWKSFNRFIAQPDGFVEPDAENSSAFWAKLSKIIERLEHAECGIHSTTPKPMPPATTVARKSTGSVVPEGSTQATTLTTTTKAGTSGECKPEIITDGPCNPTPENCNCMADVLIELGKKPDTMNLVADDKVVVKY